MRCLLPCSSKQLYIQMPKTKRKYPRSRCSLRFNRENSFRLLPALLFFFTLSTLPQIARGETIGQIKPRTGANSFNTYVWNGKVMKPNTGATCEKTWSFDGKELRKSRGAASANTYSWNGKRFRPMTGATNNNIFIWNGVELKRQTGSISSNTWAFNGQYWSLKQGTTDRNSWVVSGFVPIPLCALIILGLNDTN